MKEREVKHFVDSVVYELERTAVYCRITGAQLFTRLGLGLTFDQFVTLDTILFNPDICQRDLSKLLLKDRSNTGRILNILEESELIERRNETKGKRLVRKIYITQKGKNIVGNNRELLRDAFSNTFDNITDAEFASLRNTLQKMKDSLSKKTSIQI